MSNTRDTAVRRQMQEAISKAIFLSGRTQEDIALRASVTAKTISEIKNGKTWSSPEIIQDILDVCDVEVTITVTKRNPTTGNVEG